MTAEHRLHQRVRLLTWVFIVGLVISGATAIPLQWELDLLAKIFGISGAESAAQGSALMQWLAKVRLALQKTGAENPFLFYGTDWLAFGHFVIAIAFVGALREPIRNRWLFTFGMIACALVIPYALILGAVRGIPIWWRFIDCSFGVLGIIPLWLCQKWTRELETRNPLLSRMD